MKGSGEKVVPLRELRYKPANSNDAARAVLSHHFSQVPKCSFARDDGISQYLASETGMEAAPASPTEHIALHKDVPAVSVDDIATGGKLNFRLLRDGFAAGVLFHIVLAGALFFVTVRNVEAPSELEGVTVVSIAVDGSDAQHELAGEKEPVEELVEGPVKKPVEAKPKPVEKVVPPVQAKTQDILKDVPMPELGAIVPEILTAKEPAEPKVEAQLKPEPVEKPKEEPVKEMAAVAPQKKTEPEVKPAPVLEKPEPVKVRKAEEKPKPVEEEPEEKKPEAKKEEPRPEPKNEEPKEKPKPKEKKTVERQGNQGDAESATRRGREGKKRKQAIASDDSRGDSGKREIGNSSRTNYGGQVRKEIQRAKSRVRPRGKGTVTVAFTVASSGSISGLRVSKSSGNEKIDAAALKIVNIAAPFAPMPAGTGRRSWPMTIAIQFK